MSTNQTDASHTVAWFYLTEELGQARIEADDARAAARVYWSCGQAQHKVKNAAARVRRLEEQLA